MARGFRRLGLTGTRWLVESDVYPEKLGAMDWTGYARAAADRDEVHRIIMDELVYGICKPEAVATLQGVVGRMQAAGCRCRRARCNRAAADRRTTRHSPLPTLDSDATVGESRASAGRLDETG